MACVLRTSAPIWVIASVLLQAGIVLRVAAAVDDTTPSQWMGAWLTRDGRRTWQWLHRRVVAVTARLERLVRRSRLRDGDGSALRAGGGLQGRARAGVATLTVEGLDSRLQDVESQLATLREDVGAIEARLGARMASQMDATKRLFRENAPRLTLLAFLLACLGAVWSVLPCGGR